MHIARACELVTCELLDTIAQQLAVLDAEPGVTVRLHPVSCLGLSSLAAPSLKSRRMASPSAEQRARDLHLGRHPNQTKRWRPRSR
jgi:hypothetical protein